MKTTIIFSLSLALCANSGWATQNEFVVSDMSDARVTEFMAGDLPADTTLTVPKNTVIEVAPKATGDLLKSLAAKEPISVVVQKTFHVRIIHKTLFFSLDKINWRNMKDFMTGSLNVGFSQSASGNPAISIGFHGDVKK